jgi:hypothetical protein
MGKVSFVDSSAGTMRLAHLAAAAQRESAAEVDVAGPAAAEAVREGAGVQQAEVPCSAEALVQLVGKEVEYASVAGASPEAEFLWGQAGEGVEPGQAANRGEGMEC